MRSSQIAAVLVAAVALSGAVALAGSITTSVGLTNSVGQPVAATFDYVKKPDGIIVTVGNTTESPRYFTQTLSKITFKLKNRPVAKGSLLTSRGNASVITSDGGMSPPAAENTNWTLATEGASYTLAAPGDHYVLMPEPSSNGYVGADSSLFGDSGQRTVILGPASYYILIPDIQPEDQIDEVEFHWSEDAHDPYRGAFTDIGGGGMPVEGGGFVDNSGPNPNTLPGIGDNPYVPNRFYPDTPNYPNGDNNGGYRPPSTKTPDPYVPNKPVGPIVPEAATLSLLAAGAVGMLLRRR